MKNATASATATAVFELAKTPSNRFKAIIQNTNLGTVAANLAENWINASGSRNYLRLRISLNAYYTTCPSLWKFRQC